jgi:hypothetical protein
MIPLAVSHGIGGTGEPFAGWISTWRWGPVEWPVLPDSETCWPGVTGSPWLTRSLLLWANQETVPSQYWISSLLP